MAKTLSFESKSGHEFKIELLDRGKAQFIMGDHKVMIGPSEVVLQDPVSGLCYIRIFFTKEDIKKFPKELQPALQSIYRKAGESVVNLKVTLAEKVAEEVRNVVESHLMEWEKSSMQTYIKNLQRNKNLYIGVGGDTSEVHVAFFDVDMPDSILAHQVASRLAEVWKKRIEYYIKKHNILAYNLATFTKKTNIKTGLYNTLYHDGVWGKMPLDSDFLKEAKEEYRAYRQEQRRKAKEEESLEQKRQKAIEEAKKIGKPVVVRVLGQFDGDDYDQVRLFAPELLNNFGELGMIVVYEVAEPDGTIHNSMMPSY